MRLLNAVFAAAIAALAVLSGAIIFRGNQLPAWLAGLLVGLQPVFGSVAGSVNNDTAVNLVAAVWIFLLLRAWAQGPSLKMAVLTGLSAVLLPVAKITGFALVPVVGVAALALIARHGVRPTLRWLAVIGSTAALTAVLWVFLLSPVVGGGTGTLVNRHPAAGVVGTPTIGSAPITAVDRAEYFVQTFVPDLPFGSKHWDLPVTDDSLARWPAYVIYIQRGYGLFGWKSVGLTPNLLHVILAGLAVSWLLALIALAQRLSRWREWLGGVAILGTSAVAVLVFVSYAYASNDVRADAGEQGRYVFTAIVPLAVLISAAALTLNGLWRKVAFGLMTSSVVCLALVTWVSALRGWFT